MYSLTSLTRKGYTRLARSFHASMNAVFTITYTAFTFPNRCTKYHLTDLDVPKLKREYQILISSSFRKTFKHNIIAVY